MKDMINNTTIISWSNYLREAIDSLRKEGYHFNHKAEMDIITLAQNWRHPINTKFGCYRNKIFQKNMFIITLS